MKNQKKFLFESKKIFFESKKIFYSNEKKFSNQKFWKESVRDGTRGRFGNLLPSSLGTFVFKNNIRLNKNFKRVKTFYCAKIFYRTLYELATNFTAGI